MPTVEVKSSEGEVTGTIELPEALFDVDVNIPLVHQVVVAQLAAARQGSTRAPQFVGGGVVHGPTPRSYSQRTPKKMKAAALRSALSDRARGGRLHVVSSLVEGDTPSTKQAAAALAGVASSRHVLVVLDRTDELTWKSLRNVETVHVIAPDQLNTYDVLVSDDVVFTEGALASFVAGGKATGEAVDLLAVTPVAKPAKKAPAKKAPAPEAEPAEAVVDEPAPVKKSPAKKTAAKKAAADDDAPPAAKKAPAKKAAAKKTVAAADATDEDATEEEESQ